ncbi:MAG: hypothetical protein ACLUNO_00975 [Oscillospiraceae bacterium]
MVMALFPVIICMYDLLALILRDPTAVLRIVETLVLPRETQALVSEFLNYVSGNTSQVMFVAALFVMITSASCGVSRHGRHRRRDPRRQGASASCATLS